MPSDPTDTAPDGDQDRITDSAALPKAGDRCPCGVGPEHFYDAFDIIKMREHLDAAQRAIGHRHDLAAMTPQERHAIDCYAGAFRRKCKDPDHA